MSNVTERLITRLTEAGADFSLLHHEPARTSQEAAEVRGTPLEQGAKAMVFAADGHPLLLVLPADRRVDSRAFKRVAGIKDLRLIDAQRLLDLTGLEPGAVPPFGSLFNMPTHVDERLLALPRIAFNAGSRSTSIILPVADWVRIEQPQVARFATD